MNETTPVLNDSDSWWLQARHDLPSSSPEVFLNIGTCGPLPIPAVQIMQEKIQAELTEGRIRRESWEDAFEARAQVREELARLFGGSAHNYALQTSTTAGINAVLFGMDWNTGDEVITTSSEHAGLLLPLGILRERYGVVVRRFDAEAEEGALLRRLESLLSKRTRLIAISHVAYTTGALLPVEQVIQMAHAHGIPVLLDGAQSAGAFDVDFHALGVDYYSFPGQKWLYGPEGTGGLYVADHAIERLRLARGGYLSAAAHDQEGYYLPREGALRFEIGSGFRPLWSGWLAALRWLQSWGMERIYGRQANLARNAYRRLLDIPGLHMYTPTHHAGLISFLLDGMDSEALFNALKDHGFIGRTIPEPRVVRISIGFFHLEEELERLYEALEKIRS